MINVLHLINYAGKGGSEKYILTLIKNMQNKYCNFYVAYSEEGDLINELNSLDIEAIKLDMKNPLDLKAAIRLKKICKEKHIDVIHTHFLRENYISIFSKIMGNKIKIINTRHMLNNNGRVVSSANKLLSIFDSGFIAVSSAVKNELLNEGIASFKLHLIYTGIDIDYWKEPCKSTIRKEFNIDKEETVVTYIGRFSKEKGHGFLLKTIKSFNEINDAKADKKRVRFLLVGDGELLNHYKEEVNNDSKCGNIIFAGYRKDIKNILLGTDIYTSPSESEAFGISVIEALASGLPVVATNIGGHKEILCHKECGELVNYGDIEANVKAIIRLLYDKELYEKFRANAKVVVEENFLVSKMISETYELYKN